MKNLIKKLLFQIQCVLFGKLVNSKNAWRIFDAEKVPGFGTNLIRLYFPVYYDERASRNSFSASVTEQFVRLLGPVEKYAALNELIKIEIEHNTQLSVKETSVSMPYLDNYFFGIYDAAILAAIMQYYRPAKIVEIGSGISTRYINYFRIKYKLDIKVTCIDPAPRVNISQVADEIIVQPLEAAITANAFNLQPNDIVFMDGSHYVFQGNDTLTFFFQLLPSLPKGLLIHIHDIFLPYDYSQTVSRQLWTEQYILAAMMLNGLNNFEVIYPAYFLSQKDNSVKDKLSAAADVLKTKDFSIALNHREGYSFWLQTV